MAAGRAYAQEPVEPVEPVDPVDPVEPVEPESVALRPAESSRNVVTGMSAAVLPLTVRATAGQTANLQEWQNADGGTLLAIEPGGDVSRPSPNPEHGSFHWQVDDATFNGTQNAASYFGYNVGPKGQPVKAGEPYAAMVVEADYNDGVNRTLEMYFETRSANNQVNLRPIEFQIKRDATTVEESLIYSTHLGNPFRIRAPRTSTPHSQPPNLLPGTMADFRPNRTDLYAVDQIDTFLTIHGAADRNAGMIMRRNNAEVGRLTTAWSNQVQLRVLDQPARFYAVNGGQAMAMALNADEGTTIGLFAVGNAADTSKALVARGRSGQRGNLFEAQDSSAAVLSGFDRDGYFFTRKNTAPADPQVPTGQMALWFDAAGGRLMVKARDAIGKVVTGSLQLK